MRALSLLLTVSFVQVAIVQTSFSKNQSELGPTYNYSGQVIKDIEIPGNIGRSWSLCFPRAIRVDISSESAAEKKRITDKLVSSLRPIKSFVTTELDDILKQSNQIFRENAPRIAPLLTELSELKQQREQLQGIEREVRTKDQKEALRKTRSKEKAFRERLFGAYNRTTKSKEGGLIPALDAQRQIMDFSEVRFFHGNVEAWQARDYEKTSNLHEELRVIFRVQDAVTLGPVNTNVFSTGGLGDRVKSDYIESIESFVARSLKVSPDKVEVTGNKSMPAKDAFCQGDRILFTQY